MEYFKINISSLRVETEIVGLFTKKQKFLSPLSV